MENKINVEQIMQEIRAQAQAQPAYEPEAAFSAQGFGTGKKLQLAALRAGRKVKHVCQKFAGKFVRVFVALYLFAKNQAVSGKNVILDNAAKTNELTRYVHGDLETRLAALEDENARLKEELNRLKTKSGAQHG